MRTKLREREKVVLSIKKHWIVLVTSVAALAGAAILMVFVNVHPNLKEIEGLHQAGLLLLFLMLLYFIYQIYDRKTNIWVVTNMRVIDEWGVFTRNAVESPLDKIHNVSYNQSIFGLILGYGDVKIQTAAEEGRTVNRFVMSPKLLQNTIVRCQDEYRKLLREGEARTFSQKGTEAEDDTRECPYCAETIKAKAKLCRFCGNESNSIDPRFASGEDLPAA